MMKYRLVLSLFVVCTSPVSALQIRDTQSKLQVKLRKPEVLPDQILHNSTIPNNLVFVLSDNWEEYIDPNDNGRFISPGSYKPESKHMAYQRTLIQNGINTIEKHSNTKAPPNVFLFTTKMCEDAIQEMGNPGLLEVYQNLSLSKQYIPRSDICRIPALWKVGGYYFDLDMLSNMDVRQVMKPDIEFISVKSEVMSKGFFTSLIGATQHNPILQLSANNIVEQFHKDRYLLGTQSLKKAYEAWETEVGKKVADQKTQFLVETRQKANDERYEQQPLRRELMNREHNSHLDSATNNGCDLLVFDPPSKKIVFWSRIFRAGKCD